MEKGEEEGDTMQDWWSFLLDNGYDPLTVILLGVIVVIMFIVCACGACKWRIDIGRMSPF